MSISAVQQSDSVIHIYNLPSFFFFLFWTRHMEVPRLGFNSRAAAATYTTASATLYLKLTGPQQELPIYVCVCLYIYIYFFFFSFSFSFFVFYRAALAAYGGSQARGRIGATAAGLHHSHSNMGSEPRLRPTPQLTAMPDP